MASILASVLASKASASLFRDREEARVVGQLFIGLALARLERLGK